MVGRGEGWLCSRSRLLPPLCPLICRRIENPRIVLLDCPLEYKKGESMVRGEGVNECGRGRVLMSVGGVRGVRRGKDWREGVHLEARRGV